MKILPPLRLAVFGIILLRVLAGSDVSRDESAGDWRRQSLREPLSARQRAIAAADRDAPAPGFHGPERIGIRPRTFFLHTPAVTGLRPVSFTFAGLPSGMAKDDVSGTISGMAAEPGEYRVRISAVNAGGRAEKTLVLVVGDALALTPPLGWNSYDAFGDAVTEAEVVRNAEILKERLQPAGYDTVVVDFRWYDRLASADRPQEPEGVCIDGDGFPTPPPSRFPSAADGRGFTSLADRIHQMGLKFGIHLMRGIPRKTVEKNLLIPGSSFRAGQAIYPEGDPARECLWPNRDMWGVDANREAGQAWYRALFRKVAEWGVDFVKVDDIARNRIPGQYHGGEIVAIAEAIRSSNRSIILSLSPGETPLQQAGHVKRWAQMWRAQNDFWDSWPDLLHNLGRLLAWAPHAGPGHWPDGDMLPLGHVCIRNCDVKPDRWTRLSRSEQLTVMSAWALASSPLMLGMNLPDNDPWTWALIRNPELIAIDQDGAGNRVEMIPLNGCQAWRKKLEDGRMAVGFFNQGDQSQVVDAAWSDLGAGTGPRVRDVWLRRDLGVQKRFQARILPHDCELVLVTPKT
jgi:alpha-galactosidase